jgi:predicted MFS family arabinose efflux permease
MELIRPRAQALLAPLRHRGFRLFFGGQLVSTIGTWMQVVGQAWLVLELTHSAFLLGVISALQWSPTLLLSLPAGVLADRIPKRTLVLATQTSSALLAAVLGTLTVLGWIRYWHIAAAAALLGTVSAVDVPARQALVIELVEGPDDLTGAIALNSALFNSARLIGPSLGGLMIAAWGTGAAFLANAVSYVAVILALLAIPAESVNPVAQGVSLLMGIRDGVRFVRRTPHVLWVLMVLGVLALFPMNFEIFVPVLARTQLHVGAAGFGFLMAVQGAGALVGALGVAAMGRGVPRRTFLLGSAVVLCCATMALGLARAAAAAGGLLFVAGASMIAFTAIANSAVQLETPDALRGRVMSLYNLVYNGTTPPGALLIGWLIENAGLPAAMEITGGIGLAGTIGIYTALLRRRRKN